MSKLNSKLNADNKETKKTLAQELDGKSLWQIGEFFDTHSIADYWDEFEDVEIEIIKPLRVINFKNEREMEEVLAKENKDKGN